VYLGEGNLPDEGEALLEILLRLSREADHQVRGERRIFKDIPNIATTLR
jgi:hypothetical protein